MDKKTPVALVDDHSLLRNGLAKVIDNFDDYIVLFQANNGADFIRRIKHHSLPHIVLLDINMPEMDGYETCIHIQDHFPDIKVLALSMYDNEDALIKMFKAGAKGYILKDCETTELRAALDSLLHKGFYYSEMVTGKLIHSITSNDPSMSSYKNITQLNDRERVFLELACTEMTYKEIADKMYLSARTIDGYRDNLFDKLNVKTRVGLVIYALKNGIVSLDKLS
jgi:DNA-binding NarL/FixJ family response regulator